MQTDIEKIKEFLDRNQADAVGEKQIAEEEDALDEILRKAVRGCDCDNAEAMLQVVKEYADSGAAQRRKLLAYCVDFTEPTFLSPQATENGEQIQQHKFLTEDELVKLYKFVERQVKSFGETVYEIMDKHGMTPPEVYKNAMLNRQDFFRATDYRTKNVTRLLAWQIIIGLHCSLEEADEVLYSASIVRRDKLDSVIEWFILNENYDVMAINAALENCKIEQAFPCHKPVRDRDSQ